MNYEYKVVGAPEKPRRRRSAKTGSDRIAAAFEEILGDEAVDGWEYLRTDIVPVTERPGWFSRTRRVSRAVMVFRRPLEAVWRRPGPAEAAAKRREPSVGPAPARQPEPNPEVSADADRKLAEIVRGPGAPPRDR